MADPNERVAIVHKDHGGVNDTVTREAYDLVWKDLGWRLAKADDIAAAEKAAAKREENA